MGRGLDDAVGPHREFTRRFAERIWKLAGNMPGDHWKKTVRLTARMPEAIGLAGQGKSPDQKENAPEKKEHETKPETTCMRVDFPRLEDGDSTGWLSRAKCYFRYH
ncbi:hypothetical protein B296_00033705 [Ensete ventricosum]|uniref:Uncharacterized protein n=1 Tax=Ensete ventricosum TaxID=4639 RepID=A0A426XHS5_ENSVE|nr:hypothetical protein B296_00033705 [Ensete ventricosum]